MWGDNKDQQQFGSVWPLWHGDAATQRRQEAVKLLRQLAERGYAPAQFALAMAYFDGQGVRRDYTKAFEMFLVAANQNYPAAEGMVGSFYAMVKPKQDACPHDPEQAAIWYQRGAEHGNLSAMINLASCFKSGLGVEANPAEVYVWASLAAQLSPIRSRPAEVLRDQAVTELNGEQLKDLDRRISEMKSSLLHPWSEPHTYWKSLWQSTGNSADKS